MLNLESALISKLESHMNFLEKHVIATDLAYGNNRDNILW